METRSSNWLPTGWPCVALCLGGLVAVGLVAMGLVACGRSTAPTDQATSPSSRDTIPPEAYLPAILPGMGPQSSGMDTAMFPSSANAATSNNPSDLLQGSLPEDLLRDGWLNLFDGQSTWGWFTVGNADWRVVDKTIRVDSGDPSFLCTSFQIADYELMIDFKCPTTTNSGVFLRSVANPRDVLKDCYELNIAPPDNPFPTGSLVQRHKVEPTLAGDIAADEWHTLIALVEGASVRVRLDDKPLVEYTDPHPLGRGHICLQHRTGSIQFRNILMRPLGLANLSTGEDWKSSWRMDDQISSKLQVVSSDEGLQLKGGPGQVESTAQWDDFVMQATYRLAKPEVNSGIFFRCIPGELLNGYECQLNHALKNSNRADPLDGGAGGIFKRQPARFVVGDGTDPTYVTILAEDFQIATWINGLPIADFADTRALHPNPRRGAKQTAGTIALQGHDDTTDVVFSRIGIAKIAP